MAEAVLETEPKPLTDAEKDAEEPAPKLEADADGSQVEVSTGR